MGSFYWLYYSTFGPHRFPGTHVCPGDEIPGHRGSGTLSRFIRWYWWCLHYYASLGPLRRHCHGARAKCQHTWRCGSFHYYQVGMQISRIWGAEGLPVISRKKLQNSLTFCFQFTHQCHVLRYWSLLRHPRSSDLLYLFGDCHLHLLFLSTYPFHRHHGDQRTPWAKGTPIPALLFQGGPLRSLEYRETMLRIPRTSRQGLECRGHPLARQDHTGNRDDRVFLYFMDWNFTNVQQHFDR